MRKRIEFFINRMKKDERLRERHWFGTGSSRESYRFGDLVIKLPRNFFADYVGDELEALCEKVDDNGVYKFGILQSEKEIEVWENASDAERGVLAKIHHHGVIDGYPYIVMERVVLAEDMNEFFYCRGVIGAIEISNTNKISVPKNLLKITKGMCNRFNLAEGDLFGNDGNFGVSIGRKLVLTDYGFSGWHTEDYD